MAVNTSRSTSNESRGKTVGSEPMDLQAFADQHESDVSEAPMLAALRAEHRHIASVLALLSDHLNAIERSELVDTHVIYEIMDYMVTWPDRFHHPREDLIYGYAADVDKKLAEDRRRLEQDHDHMARNGRDLLQAVEDWRRGELSGAEVVRLGREYVQASYGHMSFEEREVFPVIDAVLTYADWRELSADDQLKPVGDPVFGRRVQREFRNMARKLRRSLRRGVERQAVAEWVSIESLFEAYEVMGMANQSGRDITREQLKRGLREASYIVLDQPLKAPFLCAVNNTRLTVQWLDDMQGVYRDAVSDLLRVNRERQDRLRLLKRAGRPG
ncbi:hemerythrin domain-containing protein [Congregibacter sp.]|uniref:hemerythrin domain-containing protein n=1 Tax=Congregibacter sp. TaxID=2744308 RepID=UPI003F6C09A1